MRPSEGFLFSFTVTELTIFAAAALGCLFPLVLADEPLRGGEGLPRRGVSAACSLPCVLALASLAIREGETVDRLIADLVGDPLVGIWIVSPRPSDSQTGHCVVWGLGGGKSVGSLVLCLREVVGRTAPETTSKEPWTQVSVGGVATPRRVCPWCCHSLQASGSF